MDLIKASQLCADYWFHIKNPNHYKNLPFTVIEKIIDTSLTDNPKIYLAKEELIDICINHFTQNSNSINFILKNEWNCDKILSNISNKYNLNYTNILPINSRSRIYKQQNDTYKLFIKSGIGEKCQFYEIKEKLVTPTDFKE